MIVAQASTDRAFFQWDWVLAHWSELGEQTVEHLFLTGTSVAIGLVISAALAAIALRWSGTFGPIIGVGGVLYSVPSLALFALLVPFTGLTSRTTAIIPLVTYTILILVRNMVAGIRSVPAEVVEAAQGMGLRRRQVFMKVEVPLALPTFFAGLRITTVTIVGLVTVTALLGFGGLGQFILNGFRKSIVFPTEIIVGMVASVLLAMVLDFALLQAQRVTTPWLRRPRS